MLTLDEIRTIPFPRPADLDWRDWPCPPLPESFVIPENVEYLFPGDMDQVCVLLSKGNVEYLICNEDYEIGFLQRVLEEILGAFIWDSPFGVHPYFWYSHTLECGETKIRELPIWCQEVMDVLLDEKLVDCLYVSESEYYYYLEGFNVISSRDIRTIYEKFRGIFLDAMNHYSVDEELTPEDLENGYKMINALLDGYIERLNLIYHD